MAANQNLMQNSSNWTSQETHCLISLWNSEGILRMMEKARKRQVYEMLSKGMQEAGYFRTTRQVNVKIRDLKYLYRRHKDAVANGGKARSDWEFFEALDPFLADRVVSRSAGQMSESMMEEDRVYYADGDGDVMADEDADFMNDASLHGSSPPPTDEDMTTAVIGQMAYPLYTTTHDTARNWAADTTSPDTARNWAADETRTLISLWAEPSVQKELKNAYRNRYVFEMIARQMCQAGWQRTWKQCQRKIKELKLRYRRARKVIKNGGNGPSVCPFYSQLYAVLGNKLDNTLHLYTYTAESFSTPDSVHPVSMVDNTRGNHAMESSSLPESVDSQASRDTDMNSFASEDSNCDVEGYVQDREDSYGEVDSFVDMEEEDDEDEGDSDSSICGLSKEVTLSVLPRLQLEELLVELRRRHVDVMAGSNSRKSLVKVLQRMMVGEYAVEELKSLTMVTKHLSSDKRRGSLPKPSYTGSKSSNVKEPAPTKPIVWVVQPGASGKRKLTVAKNDQGPKRTMPSTDHNTSAPMRTSAESTSMNQPISAEKTKSAVDKVTETAVNPASASDKLREIVDQVTRDLDGSGPNNVDESGSNNLDGSGSNNVDGSGSNNLDGSGSNNVDGSGSNNVDGSRSTNLDGSGSNNLEGSGSNTVINSYSSSTAMTSGTPNPATLDRVIKQEPEDDHAQMQEEDYREEQSAESHQSPNKMNWEDNESFSEGENTVDETAEQEASWDAGGGDARSGTASKDVPSSSGGGSATGGRAEVLIAPQENPPKFVMTRAALKNPRLLLGINATAKRKKKRGKKQKCPYCPYSVDSRGLTAHVRIHTGEKPFKCSMCDYSACQKVNLDRHMLKHTGEKPFMCGECGYRTAYKAHLMPHMLEHAGAKPFVCGECGYRSTRKSNIVWHQKTHQKERPHKCQLCPYTAKRSSEIRRHMDCKHKDRSKDVDDHSPDQGSSAASNTVTDDHRSSEASTDIQEQPSSSYVQQVQDEAQITAIQHPSQPSHESSLAKDIIIGLAKDTDTKLN
ncbi:uncharacterized protein LOC144865722 isoform X2 [Branchiostoma floridae x Branchiostoma japonicum]